MQVHKCTPLVCQWAMILAEGGDPLDHLRLGHYIMAKKPMRVENLQPGHLYPLTCKR